MLQIAIRIGDNRNIPPQEEYLIFVRVPFLLFVLEVLKFLSIVKHLRECRRKIANF